MVIILFPRHKEYKVYVLFEVLKNTKTINTINHQMGFWNTSKQIDYCVYKEMLKEHNKTNGYVRTLWWIYKDALYMYLLFLAWCKTIIDAYIYSPISYTYM